MMALNVVDQGVPAMKDHLNKFNKMILDAQAAGITIRDEDKALSLIFSMPPSWEHFTDTMLYGRDTIALSTIKNSIIRKDLDITNVNANLESHGVGLVARNKYEKGSSNGEVYTVSSTILKDDWRENLKSVMIARLKSDEKEASRSRMKELSWNSELVTYQC
ncbi:hypothetical protein ACFE04_021799 [Oxalis oulophora]